MFCKVFAILIWDIVIRNVKLTLFENIFKKDCFFYQKTPQNSVSSEYVVDKVGKDFDSAIFFLILKKSLTSFEFDKFY